MAILKKMSQEYDADQACDYRVINGLIEEGQAVLRMFPHIAVQVGGDCIECGGNGVHIDYLYPSGRVRAVYVRCACGAEPRWPPEWPSKTAAD